MTCYCLVCMLPQAYVVGAQLTAVGLIPSRAHCLPVLLSIQKSGMPAPGG